MGSHAGPLAAPHRRDGPCARLADHHSGGPLRVRRAGPGVQPHLRRHRLRSRPRHWPHEGMTPAQGARGVLESVLANQGTELSAQETLRHYQEVAEKPGPIDPRWYPLSQTTLAKTGTGASATGASRSMNPPPRLPRTLRRGSFARRTPAPTTVPASGRSRSAERERLGGDE